MNVYSLLANGMGGIDWSGLPLVAGWFGVVDMEGLMHRINIIKLHRAAKD